MKWSGKLDIAYRIAGTEVKHWSYVWTLNSLRPRQNGRHYADDNFKCIFLNENYEFWIRFHRIMFPRVQLAINKHWFRQWLGVEQGTSHCLNQWWNVIPMHICITWLQWVNILNIFSMGCLLRVFCRKLTLLAALRLKCSRRTKSVPWLLMPWLLVSAGHQHPWYWLWNKEALRPFVLLEIGSE